MIFPPLFDNSVQIKPEDNTTIAGLVRDSKDVDEASIKAAVEEADYEYAALVG